MPPTPAPAIRPRRPAHGAARTALLDAAHALVRRQGWAATSVDALCGAAGVTKGAFFHHFASKDALGLAAARHWGEITAPLFAAAPYHQHADPLERILGYLSFRAAIARGPMEAWTCFAGTTLQEVYASNEPLRAACGETILDHAAVLADDFRAAIERYPPVEPVTARGLALHTQVVLQGGFVLAKARADRAPLIEAIAHLERYLRLLFRADRPRRRRNARPRNRRRTARGD